MRKTGNDVERTCMVKEATNSDHAVNIPPDLLDRDVTAV